MGVDTAADVEVVEIRAGVIASGTVVGDSLVEELENFKGSFLF